VATVASRPASRDPSWRSLRMIRRLICCTTVTLSGLDGGLTVHKPGVEARFGPIEIYPLKEDAIEMEVHIDRTAETLDKGD